jgi:DNA-binding transcriptional LysR family regulator
VRRTWPRSASAAGRSLVGPFITSVPKSVAYFKSMKILPVDLPVRPWPVNIAQLKNRTLQPVVERFIDHLRDFTKPMRAARSIWKQ